MSNEIVDVRCLRHCRKHYLGDTLLNSLLFLVYQINNGSLIS